MRGIGEKFAANPVTGTGSMSVPIATSPGRAGFGPQLALAYDSGSGNGPFGFGWHLSLPAITRRTDKGLPQYEDGADSDIFLISGAEDLVPLLVTVGDQWQRPQVPPRTVNGVTYRIEQYRPRIEGMFARIERWTDVQTGEIHWRSISKENVTTLYGQDNASRIFDPVEAASTGHPQRIFTWLICASYDDKGNAVLYEYKAEDDENIDRGQANESNRTTLSRSANRYLKRIKYGNLPSHLVQPDLAQMNWMFEVVFDYGEHDPNVPTPVEAQPWLCRNDPFSSYRGGFEVRTYRLCQRVLMFHHFPDEPTAGQDCLVRSTDFVYQSTRNNPDDLKLGNPLASFLATVTQRGYRRKPDGSYLNQPLPPLDFSYSHTIISQEVREVDAASLENLPAGLDGKDYRWVDLDAEGVSGILTEQAGAWFYKPNLGDGQFGPLELIARKPAPANLRGGEQQLISLDGDGRLDLVEFAGPAPGFFRRTEDQEWEDFMTFVSLPELTWNDPNLRFVDLDGDGLTDVLITEHEALVWHQSLAEAGFGPAQYVSKSLDEELGPKLVFADGVQSVYLADMSGDGLSDLVRVRNGEVCYWPNLGYGRFGRKVTMDDAPWFASNELFDERRLRLADIDGSGTTDLIYLGGDAIQVYFNLSGNSWSTVQALSPLPHLDRLSSVMTVDLLGNGTACLVWSSPLPGDARQPLRYIDLMGGQKPHLLISMKNNLGTETLIQYAPSTRFYLADKLAGQPWVTRLPFPVHVVERVEVDDRISGNRFVTRYAYHHGYFDGFEREFRGFGMVEQWDTEELAALTASGTLPPATNIDATSYIPPVLTRTWFHTGVFLDQRHISRVFEDEYYHEGDAATGVAGLSDAQLEAMLLDDSILPTTVRLAGGTRQPYNLNGYEAQEACRALKGSLLRKEIYALDGTDAADCPYTVEEHNYTLELLQPQSSNRHAVLFVHPRESVEFHYERILYDVNGQKVTDPRVNHEVTLAVDDFGNVLQKVGIAYGRRHDDPDHLLTDDDRKKQKHILILYTESQYTNAIQQVDAYRIPLLSDMRTYELIHLIPDANQPQVTNLFRFDELSAKVQQASDGLHDLPPEDVDARGAMTGAPYRRLLEWERLLYRKDDLSASLPCGQVQALALSFEHYSLAFTPGLLTSVYQRKSGNAIEALLPDPATVLGKEGGYLRSNELKASGTFPASDPDDYWWAPSGEIFYSPGVNDTPAQELSYAVQHFFLEMRFQDPFAQTTTVLHDAYDLLIQETVDPLGSRVSAGIRDLNGNLTATGNDYRVLHASLLMDTNRNRSAVAFDALGMVVGTALMGKPEEHLGDTLDGFVIDLADATIAAHLQDPLTDPYSILQRATSRLVYDLFAYQRTHSDARPQPPVVYTLTRETHDADLSQGEQPKVQHGFTYSDGFGREIQKKLLSEPGPLVEGGAVTTPRWIGSGWTIFNNKGKAVREYEPFFSATHQFEFAVQVGVSSIHFYDPVERNVAILHPNHSYEKVVFDPWKQIKWDVNDTVLLAPRTDPDVGDFFQRLPDADYLPTWYDQRQGGGLGAQEQAAAQKTALHAGTPTITFFDTLGHSFLTVAHNRVTTSTGPVDTYYANRTIVDIQGRSRALSDARNRVVTRYAYDLPGDHIYQASMDTGERWMLEDVLGKRIRTWDSRDHMFRTEYDALRRQLRQFVQQGNANEQLISYTVYGEGHPDALALNLRGNVFMLFDKAGVVTNLGKNPGTSADESYDFKGNLLRSSRQLVPDYHQAATWAGLQNLLAAWPLDLAAIKTALTPLLEAEVFVSSTTYNAINRPVTQTMPDQSVLHLVYNTSNLLEQVMANLRGEAAARAFITKIDYNARGQRTLVTHGNGIATSYRHDPLTFHIVQMQTARAGAMLQDLTYTYDPTGNITHLQDNSDIQNVVYFRNRRVEPSSDYVYDAVYRLIQAAGREQLGLNASNQNLPPMPSGVTDSPRVRLLQPGDGNAMGTYTETYTYDEASNILQLQHVGQSGQWVRDYAYSEPSLLEAQVFNNRLSSTTIGGLSEAYSYDAHGNSTSMPHLATMAWDIDDHLQMVDLGGGGHAYYVYDASGQRLRKVIERQNGTRQEERIYLGGYEVYRVFDGGGNTPTLERQSLHIMDDRRRAALVETKTIDTSAAPFTPAPLIRYQHDNHLGSACLELDDQGQVITYEEYYPYGSTSYQAGRSLAEVSLKRYRYTGKERDEESGFYYHGARYYICWLGRWTSGDPVGPADSLNVYVYVRCDPVNASDPTGLWSLRDVNWRTVAVVTAVVVVSVAVTVATAGVAGPVVAGAAAGVFGAGTTAATVATGVVVGAVAGAASGAAGELTRQAASGEISQRGGVDWGSVKGATVSGLVAGGVTGGLGAASSAARGVATSVKAARSVGTFARSVGTGALHGAAGGGAGELARQVVSGEHINLGRVARAAGTGALIGGGVRAASPIVRPLISPLSRVPGVNAGLRAVNRAGLGLARKVYAPGSQAAQAAENYAASLNHPVTQNRLSGGRFEQRVRSHLAQVEGQTGVREQVSIRPNIDAKGTPADYTVKVDFLGRQGGAFRISDAKGSPTAPFTKNQTPGYPLIEKFGGTVIGQKGGAAYPAGTPVPPTKIDVYRPGPGGQIQKGGI